MTKKLDQLIEQIDTLPNLFNVGVLVLNKLENPNTQAKDLAKIISVDQSLTTQLLKMCNSAHYGFSRKISNLQEAIAKIGFKDIKSLIFLSISKGVLKREIAGYSLGKDDLWKNSITCAVYSRKIAELSDFHDPDTAFTAGLLKDMGKLIINQFISSSYDKIISNVKKEHLTFPEAEEKVLGYSHAEIGARVAEKWNFPEELVNAIKYHHRPSNCKDKPDNIKKLIYVVHLADIMTTMTGVGMGSDGMMYKMDMETFKVLPFKTNIDGVEKLFSELIDLTPEIEEMTGLANEKY